MQNIKLAKPKSERMYNSLFQVTAKSILVLHQRKFSVSDCRVNIKNFHLEISTKQITKMASNASSSSSATAGPSNASDTVQNKPTKQATTQANDDDDTPTTNAGWEKLLAKALARSQGGGERWHDFTEELLRKAMKDEEVLPYQNCFRFAEP